MISPFTITIAAANNALWCFNGHLWAQTNNVTSMALHSVAADLEMKGGKTSYQTCKNYPYTRLKGIVSAVIRPV